MKNALKKIDKHFKTSVAIQGEICGPGIQKNIYNFPDFKFFLYGAYDIKTGRRMNIDELIEEYKGVKKLFRQVIKLIMQTVAMAGLIRGRTILNSLWIKFAPSIAAASSRETGISEAKFFNIKTVKGITPLIYRMISPR